MLLMQMYLNDYRSNCNGTFDETELFAGDTKESLELKVPLSVLI